MQQLEGVLGSKGKIGLLRFLCQNIEWQFNLSEISRKISTDKGNLSRIIKEFEKNGIVETKRSGKLLLFKLNENNDLVMKSIIPLFRGEEK